MTTSVNSTKKKSEEEERILRANIKSGKMGFSFSPSKDIKKPPLKQISPAFLGVTMLSFIAVFAIPGYFLFAQKTRSYISD